MTVYNIIDKIVQYGYDKNNILCIGKKSVTENTAQQFYAIVIPTLEQLVYQEDIEKNEDEIQIINVQNINKWYCEKDKRNIILLQYETLISNFLTIMDVIYIANPALVCNKNIEVKTFLFQLFNQHYNGVLIDKEKETYMDKDIFLKQLTHAEQNALGSIAQEIGSCGVISISKMIQKYLISRPVWTNLFKKMQEFKVGEVINQGVKGTYINITHPQLRYDAEHHKI